MLRWQTLNLKDDAFGLLPFFIEWSANSPHASAGAPPGLRLLRFEIATPQPEALAKTVALLSLDVSITKGKEPQLKATVAGPQGKIVLSSLSGL